MSSATKQGLSVSDVLALDENAMAISTGGRAVLSLSLLQRMS